jgi:Leucine-rich repeat (LRR) protein
MSASKIMFYTVLFIGLFPLISSECLMNVQCKCHNINDDEVACNDVNKTLTFLELFSSAKGRIYLSISINNKNVPNLTDSIFTGLSALALDLSLNEIESISEYTFSGIKLLKELKLSSNKLKSISLVIKSITSSSITTLKRLELDRNSFDSILHNFTENFANLEWLNLANNQIIKIVPGVFKNLVNLTKLVLSNNKLTSIKDINANFFTRRFELYLSYNNLNRIFSEEILPPIIELLELKGSSLMSIEPFAFINSRISSLNLKDNNIRILLNNTFRGLFNLNELYMSSSKIEIIEDGCFRDLKYLTTLDMKKNRLSFISRQTFQDLESVMLMNIEYNRINSIEDYAFAKLENLVTLDLSYNKIQFITRNTFIGLVNLATLNLQRNPILRIESNSFSDMRTLGLITPLSLRRLRLESLPRYLFNGTVSAAQVKIDRNRIKSLQRFTFYQMKSVLKLNLDSNMIASIENRTFEDMQRLEILYLSFNSLTKLNQEMFIGLDELYELYIRYNSIREIESSTFKGMSQLKYLYLDYNQLIRFEPGTFGHLSSLEELELSYNKIEEIKAHYFRRLFQLRHLRLLGNRIIRIESGSFKNLSNLHALIIGENSIRVFGEGAFDGITNLKLNLSANQIDSIPVSYFEDSALQELYLAHARLKFVLAYTFMNMIKLTMLKLSENEIEFVSEKFYWFNVSDPKRANCPLDFISLAYNRIKSLSFLNNAFLKNIRELDLTGNLIEEIKTSDFKASLLKLKLLHLSKNNIHRIEPSSFSLSEIQTLDLSNLELNSTFDLNWIGSSIRKLHLSNNHLIGMKLKSMKNLQTLFFSNVQVKSLESIKFYTYFPNLKDLDLSRNVVNFTIKLFANFESPKWLNLSRTGLVSLEFVNAKDVARFSLLDLSFNDIEVLYKNQLAGVTVAHFFLNNNKIKFIEPGFFEYMNLMVELDVSNNLLESTSLDDILTNTKVSRILFSNNLISKLTEYKILDKGPGLGNKINYLDLSVNKLTNVSLVNVDLDVADTSNDFFTVMKMTNIEILLNNNLLEKVTNTQFASLNDLAQLSLFCNQIESIEAYSFYDLDLLVMLNLSSNKLRDLEEATFYGLTQLIWLDLSHNYIENIAKVLFAELFKLSWLDVRNNRLKFIENWSLQKLLALKYLNLEGNVDLRLSNESLTGIKAIQNIVVSFGMLKKTLSNVGFFRGSLEPEISKKVNDIVFYNSINILYYDREINCGMTLYFMKAKIHFNLKTDTDVKKFFNKCLFFELVLPQY